VHTHIGRYHILQGVDFTVPEGETTMLLGRNGAGKTTTLKSIMGIVGKRQGSVRFEDKETIRANSDRIARMGIAFCPEERGIFASLDVKENLLLPPQVKSGGLSLEQIFELFPNLEERLSSQGTKLSGGEQQMLAIGRILRTGARLLLLDEPTEGLAPVIIQQIGKTIARLKDEGFTILLGKTAPVSGCLNNERSGEIKDENINRSRGTRCGTRLGGIGRRAEQECEDRFLVRSIEPLCGYRRSRLDARRANGGRGFRHDRQGVEDRCDLRRSPEQAGRRRQHRSPMVRCREGGRHRRCPEFGRGTRRQQCRQGQE
jgi:branched-chain amino acid transport system ATP-binding protein